ncbi:MAG: hypothetical protein HDT30_11070 [Clostridiales bacterium]|nr:hypothetical protein [Clostridiales bacterium]MDE7425263.1 hypothetical protein [Lachnospiraceae bacterium]
MNLIEIIFSVVIGACLVIIIGGRIVLQIVTKYYEKNPDAASPKCKKCKIRMTAGEGTLYLIPAMFDMQHEESAEYYLNNTKRIYDESQIPKGQRACRMFVFRCPQCDEKVVSVVDFLQNSENGMICGGDIYPYEKFRDFLSS